LKKYIPSNNPSSSLGMQGSWGLGKKGEGAQDLRKKRNKS